MIPVSVRGTTYHCPLVFYLPLDYPAKPPIVQVLPTPTMQVKQSAHVDPKTNRVVVPYMSDWDRKGEVRLLPVDTWLSGLCAGNGKAALTLIAPP